MSELIPYNGEKLTIQALERRVRYTLGQLQRTTFKHAWVAAGIHAHELAKLVDTLAEVRRNQRLAEQSLHERHPDDVPIMRLDGDLPQ